MNRFVLLSLFSFAGCGDDDAPPGGDADTDTDSDSDSDSDTGSDTDTGSESDTDTSSESETGPCDEGADCGVDTDCVTWACVLGECVMNETKDGTPVEAQVPGDCRTVLCDGAGGVRLENDPSDTPGDDGNVCTVETCDGGSPVVRPAEEGTLCEDGLFCTAGDECEGLACVGGANPCAGHDVGPDCADSCSEVTDDCTANDAAATPCDDGLFCTENESCDVGVCSRGTNPCPGHGAGPSCDDSCDEIGDECAAPDAAGTLCNEDGDGSAGNCSGAADEPNCIGD